MLQRDTNNECFANIANKIRNKFFQQKEYVYKTPANLLNTNFQENMSPDKCHLM